MVTDRSLRIVCFGTPDFAVPTLRRLIDSRHQVVAVVSQPDRPRGRGRKLAPTSTKTVALECGIPVSQPERLRDDAFLQEIARFAPDLGVVAAYGRLLPEALLTIPPLGMVNVHGSLLPKWRGAAPVHRAVMAGDPQTGVTIMRVVKALDAGPMLATRTRPIGPDETSVEVEEALAELGATLLVNVVDRLAAGTAVETPQDDSAATYAPKIVKAEGILDWSLPARQIHDRVRGLHPWPLASSRIGDRRVIIHRTLPTEATASEPPGTIVRAESGQLDVAAGDGQILRIVQLQPEGRRSMTAREFLAGHPLEPGSRFERE